MIGSKAARHDGGGADMTDHVPRRQRGSTVDLGCISGETINVKERCFSGGVASIGDGVRGGVIDQPEVRMHTPYLSPVSLYRYGCSIAR